MGELHRVCVYCGSSPGHEPVHLEAAQAVGRLLAARGIELVYGGGNVGLMGAVADAAMAAGGRVVGIIPEDLMAREVGHRDVSELRVVGSMHERKLQMAELSDAFLALPGGIGTVEELVEAWTWTQLRIHDKPVALLDVAGYYRPLVAFFDHAVEAGFLRPEHRATLLVDDDPAALLDAMAAWRPVRVGKWTAAPRP